MNNKIDFSKVQTLISTIGKVNIYTVETNGEHTKDSFSATVTSGEFKGHFSKDWKKNCFKTIK